MSNFGDEYSGGGRLCGELYSAKAGFVVRDNSPYVLGIFVTPLVGDIIEDDVLMCGVYSMRCRVSILFAFRRSNAFSSEVYSSSLFSCGTTSGFLSSEK